MEQETSAAKALISVVIPVYNEEENVPVICDRIRSVLDENTINFEILFVNDGSSDRTERNLAELAKADPRVKVVNFRRNHGQTAALMAGFDMSKGDIIVPMDGDLQNDPADIPLMLAKLDEGYSVVSGWRADRKDEALRRNLPSRMANWLISRISGVHLHDYGCTLKAYRREVLQDVRLYGEMHRFIPIYASWHGANITEMKVRHHPRIHGTSKYGLNRIVKVVLDLIVVKFLDDFNTKPIYVFGFPGILSIAISFIAALWAVWLKIEGEASFIQTPLPLIAVMSFSMGIIFILLGLLAEVLVRVYYESQGKSTYYIRSTHNLERD